MRLDGQRVVDQPLEVVLLAVVGDFLAVEQLTDDPHRLVEPVQALARAAPELQAVGLMLELEPSSADALDCPTARDVIERGGLLCDQAGIPECIGADQQAQSDPLGHGSPGAKD